MSRGIENLSTPTLAGHHSAVVRAQEAALEVGRIDLHVSACELAALYRSEIRRRTAEAFALGQGALDRLNAELDAVRS